MTDDNDNLPDGAVFCAAADQFVTACPVGGAYCPCFAVPEPRGDDEWLVAR